MHISLLAGDIEDRSMFIISALGFNLLHCVLIEVQHKKKSTPRRDVVGEGRSILTSSARGLYLFVFDITLKLNKQQFLKGRMHWRLTRVSELFILYYMTIYWLPGVVSGSSTPGWFVTSCTGHLANIGSNITNIDTLDYTIFLKSH